MNELSKEEKFIKNDCESFTRNNVLNDGSRFLYVALLAQKAGTYLDLEKKRKYSIGSNEVELKKIIKDAEKDRISWEAVSKIFNDLNELQRPIPKTLAHFIIDTMEGDNIKRPRKPQVWNNHNRDIGIKYIAMAAKKEFPYLTLITSDNRNGNCNEKTICGMIAKHLNMEAGTVLKVINNN